MASAPNPGALRRKLLFAPAGRPLRPPAVLTKTRSRKQKPKPYETSHGSHPGSAGRIRRRIPLPEAQVARPNRPEGRRVPGGRGPVDPGTAAIQRVLQTLSD